MNFVVLIVYTSQVVGSQPSASNAIEDGEHDDDEGEEDSHNASLKGSDRDYTPSSAQTRGVGGVTRRAKNADAATSSKRQK